MKHILILTFLLPVICLGQKDKGARLLIPEAAVTVKVTPQIGDTWRIADTIYTVNRNNEIEKYVRVRDVSQIDSTPIETVDVKVGRVRYLLDSLAAPQDSCEHIWVEEYEQKVSDALKDAITVVCLKCYKEVSQPKRPYLRLPGWLYPDPQMNPYSPIHIAPTADSSNVILTR